jgi:hypothetical protein
MKAIHSFLFKLTCFICPMLPVAAQVSPEFVLVKNQEGFKDYNKDNFLYDEVIKKVTVEHHAQSGGKIIKGATDLDCLIFYPGNNTSINWKELDTEDGKIEIKLTSAPDISLTARPQKQNAILFDLKEINRYIVRETEIELNVVRRDTVLASISIKYSTFPFGDTREGAVGRWLGAYNKNAEWPKPYKFEVVHQMTRTNFDPMYLSLPTLPWVRYSDKNILSDNEGRKFILEGSLSMPFVVMQGTADQSRFLQYSSVTIDPEFTWRIMKYPSSPLLPLNTKVGATFLHSEIIGIHKKSKQKERPDTVDWGKGRNLNVITYGLRIMHYSNGQKEGVIDSTDFSIDFKSGNFSTNYGEAILQYNSLNNRFGQTSVGLSYRRDFPLPGFAEFEASQRGVYGMNRFNFMFQYKSGVKIRCWPFRLRMHHVNKNNHDNAGNKSVMTPSLVEHGFRFDAEYIFDNTVDDRFTFARLRYFINPLRHRSAGYFVQTTIGRDYLNIRYQLTGVTVMAGFTYTFNKRYPRVSFLREKLRQAYSYYQSPVYTNENSHKTKYLKQWCDCFLRNKYDTGKP